MNDNSWTAVGLITWLFGIVLAPGWLKLIAFLLPPYAWYLFAERTLQLLHFIQ